MKVYLGGPITTLEFDAASGWRVELQRDFAAAGIEAFSPLRGKEHLRNVGVLAPVAEKSWINNPMSHNQAIFARDTFDVKRCDVFLANLLGAEFVSIGTCFELGLAWSLCKYIVVVMEKGNVHEHIFPLQCASIKFDDLVVARNFIANTLVTDLSVCDIRGSYI